MRTVAVLGGGVIGLAVAWRAAAAGWSVTLFDPALGRGASWVAGGMLAPLSEAWPGEDEVVAFGASALAAWPNFARDLEQATGTDVFVADQTVTVALDPADMTDLGTIAEWLRKRGNELELLDRQALRTTEPGLARAVCGGLLSRTEPAIDNRRLLTALEKAARDAGVRICQQEIGDPHEPVADQIVLATGAASGTVWPGLPVRPVKGEVLRLGQRPGCQPPPRRVVRARVHGRSVYLVPRQTGLVVGATQYEAGFDSTVTVAGVRDLLLDAERILPGIGDYALVSAEAAARPATPDNLPLIGRLDDRVLVATGHGRGGMLTVALTAAAVVAELAGKPLSEVRVADPHRFTAAARSVASG